MSFLMVNWTMQMTLMMAMWIFWVVVVVQKVVVNRVVVHNIVSLIVVVDVMMIEVNKKTQKKVVEVVGLDNDDYDVVNKKKSYKVP